MRRVRPRGPEGDQAPGGDGSAGGLGAGLERLARAFALAGGVLLVAVVGMTVASIVGRYLFGMPIPGEYEITELVCGIAVFAFLPHCHLTQGNVVVDFFTNRVRRRHRTMLDGLHSIAFAVVSGLVGWRLLVGGLRKLEDGETTLFLEIPIHPAYFAAVVAAGLLTAACVLAACRHLRALRE